MSKQRKVISAGLAILLAIALTIASRMWPRSAADKLVESSIAELTASLGEGDHLKARVLFGLPAVITDTKLEELAKLVHKNGLGLTKTTYLGSVEGKIGDHAVLSSMFLLKYSDDSEMIFNVMSQLASWENSKPFVMTMTISESVEAARKTVAFFPTENGMRSFVLLIMGIASLLVSTYAVYIALLRRPKHWYAWLILALVGVLRFRLNWATEEYDVQLFNVAIPVFEIVRFSELSPYLITFGVPVGAIAFLNHFGSTDART